MCNSDAKPDGDGMCLLHKLSDYAHQFMERYDHADKPPCWSIFHHGKIKSH